MNVLEWAASVLGSQGSSGAIDVVAIKKVDGIIECSPFHVKLINSNTKRKESKIVKLKVNGQPVPLSMKLGRAGEAFFLEKKNALSLSPSKKNVKHGRENFTVTDAKTLNTANNMKETIALLPPVECTPTVPSFRRVRSFSLGDSVDKPSHTDTKLSTIDDNNRHLRNTQLQPQNLPFDDSFVPLENTFVDIPFFNVVSPTPTRHLLSSTTTDTEREIDFEYRKLKRAMSDVTDKKPRDVNHSSSSSSSISRFNHTNQSRSNSIICEESDSPHPVKTSVVTVPLNDSIVPSTAPSPARVNSAADLITSQKEFALTTDSDYKSNISYFQLPHKSANSVVQSDKSVTNEVINQKKQNNFNLNVKKSRSQPIFAWTWSWGALPVRAAPEEDKVETMGGSSHGHSASLEAAPSDTPATIHDEIPVRESLDPKSINVKQTPFDVTSMQNLDVPMSSEVLNQYTREDSLPYDRKLVSENANVEPAIAESDFLTVFDAPKHLELPLFSMCGHILSEEPDAPEPAPRSSSELVSVLNSYIILPQNLSSHNINDPSLVVIVDDYILSVTTAFKLLTFAEGSTNPQSNCKTDSEITSEKKLEVLQNFEFHLDLIKSHPTCNFASWSADSKSRELMPRWDGVRISEWKSADTAVTVQFEDSDLSIRESTDRGENDDLKPIYQLTSVVANVDEGMISVHKQQLFSICSEAGRDITPVTWSESFTDLNTSFSLYKNHKNDATQQSYCDILKDYVHKEGSPMYGNWDLSSESMQTPGRDAISLANEDLDKGKFRRLSRGRMSAFVSQDSLQTVGIDLDDLSKKRTYSRSSTGKNSSGADVSNFMNSRSSQNQIIDSIDNKQTTATTSDKPDLEIVQTMPCLKADITVAVEEEANELEHLSLEDIPYELISPEPAGGDFYDSDTDSYLSGSTGESHSAIVSLRKYRYRKVLVPSQESLQNLGLQDGENEIIFEVEGNAPLKSQLFLWSESAKIVIADTETATVTPVKAGSVWESWMSSQRFRDKLNQKRTDMSHILTSIYNQGYNILYIAQHTNCPTKEYLSKLIPSSSSTSGATQSLPPGPIFQSPDTLVRAFGAERTDLFKAAALRGLKSLFPSTHNPYFASFGTREKDCLALTRCGVPEGRIFLVNEAGQIVLNSNKTLRRSFPEFMSSIQEMFPSLVTSSGSNTQPTKSSSAAASILVTTACPGAVESKEHNDQLVNGSTSKSCKTKSAINTTGTSVSVGEDAYSDFSYWRVPVSIIE